MLAKALSCFTDGLFSSQANAHSNHWKSVCQAHSSQFNKSDKTTDSNGYQQRRESSDALLIWGVFGVRLDLVSLAASLPWRFPRSGDPQDAPVIAIKAVLGVVDFAVLALNSYGESLVGIPSFHP